MWFLGYLPIPDLGQAKKNRALVHTLSYYRAAPAAIKENKMITLKHEQIVFDIIDELTDEAPFANWWWDLPDTKRDALIKTLELRTQSNLKPPIRPRRPIRGIGKN